ncbi:hypothetical protein EYZ11_012379 [Aspergillus tanneri]|uniref:BTB domain-containing protein n=1 Tax=Aspergillus tanneri TaxID=1220188 RepID=A0A4S3J0E1_9EURO|nr:hypothetical protein EYZ11_012379 [Aspergillus tanneri]
MFKLSKILSSGRYSDLTLTCDGQKFNVHKAIVCSQSPVLAAACNGNFQVGAPIGGLERLNQMVEFLYNQDYTADKSHATTHGQSTSTARSILRAFPELTPKYSRKCASTTSTLKLRAAFQSKWSTETFSAVVQEAVGITGDLSLQDMLASTAAGHIEELLSSETFINLETLHGLPISILQAVLASHQGRLETLGNEIRELSLEIGLTSLHTPFAVPTADTGTGSDKALNIWIVKE